MKQGAEAQFYPTPDNSCPPGGSAQFLALKPDLRIRVAAWPGGTHGTVILLQGRTETIEKYFETIGELKARGLSVVTLDWRGQGASSRALRDPLKGHVHDFAEYMEDLAAVLETLGPDLPRPHLLLAHSMGSHIALRAVREWPDRFQGAVLGSPMIRIKGAPGALVMLLSRFLSPDLYLPGLPRDPYSERFESNPVTHDPKRFARNLGIINAHRALALGAPTWGWLQAAIASGARLQRPGFLEAVRTPMLILSAERERIIDNTAHVEIARRLKRVTQIVVPQARHELLQEIDAVRQAFWRGFDSFTAGL
jgi:lysophospholipase